MLVVPLVDTLERLRALRVEDRPIADGDQRKHAPRRLAADVKVEMDGLAEVFVRAPVGHQAAGPLILEDPPAMPLHRLAGHLESDRLGERRSNRVNDPEVVLP